MRRFLCAISLLALTLAQLRAAPCTAADPAQTTAEAPAEASATHHHHHAPAQNPENEVAESSGATSHGQPCTMVVQCHWLAMPSVAAAWSALRPHPQPEQIAGGQLPATVDASTTTPPPRRFS